MKSIPLNWHMPLGFRGLLILPIVFFPALTLVVRGSANACMAWLMLCGCMMLRRRAQLAGTTRLFMQFWPIHLAMLSMVVITFFSELAAVQLSHGAFHWRVLDTPLRLAFFAPILWILLSLSSKDLRNVQWGFSVGALLAAIQIHMTLGESVSRVARIGFVHIIPHGDISLLLGACSLWSLGWRHRSNWILDGLKYMGAAAGIYASLLSQSRGGWLAIPILIGIGFVLLGSPRKNIKIWISVFVMVLSLSAILLSSNTVQRRIGEAKADILQFQSGQNIQTSVGTRFQLWHASIYLFREHPWLGVSRGGFSDAMHALAQRRVITNDIVEFTHSHNEMLFNMATLGGLGALATLSIYLLPGLYFLKRLRHADRPIATAAAMGFSTCIGFAVFGLTEALFVVSMTSAFYTLLIATILAFIAKRQQELLAQNALV